MKKNNALKCIILPCISFFTFSCYAGYLVKIPLEQNTGGLLVDGSVNFSETPIKIESFSIKDNLVSTSKGEAIPGAFTYGFNFSASNVDKLYLVDESGNRTDVTGKNTYTWTVANPVKDKIYHLEGQRKDKTQKSANISINSIKWCRYGYNTTMWKSMPNSLGLIYTPDGINTMTYVSNSDNKFLYSKNGWNYTTHAIEENAWYNDAYYAVCKTADPIDVAPLTTRAYCADYETNKNYWVDLDNTYKKIMWNDGITVINKTIVSNVMRYVQDGWEYYNDPYDTGDAYYPICRQKAH